MFISSSGVGRSTQQARYNLLQLIDSLYEYRSIILTTTKNLISWGEFFHDDNVEVPIIDRTIHHSHFLCWEAKLSTEAESYKIHDEEWAK
ncbi:MULTISPECIES: ATP-binding protein [Marinobacter]|uniref:ATP-binding protein n=1 Tax=Marinobacter TaxID=2742 RepID=UPI000718E916|nr:MULTISPECIES: ATP-binding protein [Marinobacter]AMQ89596.1 hypothetical protein ASQ50_13290 [Marinobacter sp. LQ44]WBU39903.1 ATP-binding protein [Marinobacter alkaliphilus]